MITRVSDDEKEGRGRRFLSSATFENLARPSSLSSSRQEHQGERPVTKVSQLPLDSRVPTHPQGS